MHYPDLAFCLHLFYLTFIILIELRSPSSRAKLIWGGGKSAPEYLEKKKKSLFFELS